MLFSFFTLVALAGLSNAAIAAAKPGNADAGRCEGAAHALALADPYGGSALVRRHHERSLLYRIDDIQAKACASSLPNDRTGMWSKASCVAAAIVMKVRFLFLPSPFGYDSDHHSSLQPLCLTQTVGLTVLARMLSSPWRRSCLLLTTTWVSCRVPFSPFTQSCMVIRSTHLSSATVLGPQVDAV